MTNIKKYRYIISISQIVVVLFGVFIVSSQASHAYTAERYETDQQLVPGSVVTLMNSGEFNLTEANSNHYTGVVARQSGTSIDLVNSGVAHVLVSDIDGDISSGDRIGISQIHGVGSKLVADQYAIGVALEQLSSNSLGWKLITFNGITTHIARIPIQLGDSGQPQNGSAANTLQQFAEKLLKKPVTIWGAIAALVVGLGGALLAFFLVFRASRETFFSLGRNPLASHAILSGFWKIVAFALVIMLTSLLMAYLIAGII